MSVDLKQTKSTELRRERAREVRKRQNSPLVHEHKLAVDGVPGDVLGGLDADVDVGGLGDDVGVQAPDGHQAAEVAALVVGLVVLVQAHLGGGPALQVARAVDGSRC